MPKIAPVAPRTIRLPQTVGEELQLIVDEPPTPPALALGGDADPHLNVFVVNFDGTGNDRDHVRPGEVETLVARFDKHFRAEETTSFRSIYVPGVFTPASMKAKGHADGTAPDAGVAVAEGMFGHGVAKRAEQALQAFNAFVRERREADPSARFHVHINAFSRGCASALVLANKLHAVDAAQSHHTGRSVDGSFVRTSGVLLDAVTTGVATALDVVAGALESDLPTAWQGRVRKERLQLPPTGAAFLHLVSGGDDRFLFSSRDLKDPLRPSELAWARGIHSAASEPDDNDRVKYQRLTTLKFPMLSHADMASGFPGSSASAVVEFAACSYMQALGLPVKPTKPTPEVMAALTASHWGLRQMADESTFDWLNRLPYAGAFRAAVAWVDRYVRQPASLSDEEVDRKAALERRVGATPKRLLPGAPELLVSQEATLVRTGSVQPISAVDGVAVSTSTPVMSPEGREGLMGVDQACRIELIDFRAEAGTVEVSKGYYFDRLGALLRANHSRVVGAPLRHLAAELVQLNGPVTLVVRQEKAIPMVEGNQLPNAKAVFEAMLAASKPLAPATRSLDQVLTAPALGGGLIAGRAVDAKHDAPLEMARGEARSARGLRPR